ncbi:undecaprenyl/decaprenyl-phosphate alpha-N-acetylglucosaminyl 1-phosphate transferase [bacterium]|nr:undecaprenyl/decaprenyl-phosphate alpha-N-acetylglucosaminyl 1-phosphate transferase [bacterium]
MPGFGSFLLIGAVAAVVTFVTTPLVGVLARRQGWVYLPNDRTVHQSPLPDVGGLAMYVGFLAAMLTAWTLDAFDVLFASNSEPIGVLIAATIIYAVGFVDDVRGLSPPAKVAGTVAAGLALVQFGVVMYAFRLPFFDGPILLAQEWRPLVTVLWLLGMTQAINLIDGLDGLAAGIVAIGAGAFFLYSQELIDSGVLDVKNIGPLLAIVAVGVCIGFLPHNFNPARIMMGDGGALLLGLLLAVATSVVGGRADSFSQEFVGQTYFFLAPLAIPLLILGVPVFDLAFAIFRRATSRRSLSTADKGHLHHRLMDLGHGHRRSVVILWTWTLLLSAFVLYPTLTGRNPAYLPFGIVALAIVLFTVLHPSVRARRRATADPAADSAAESTVPAAEDLSDDLSDEETLTEGLPPTGSAH